MRLLLLAFLLASLAAPAVASGADPSGERVGPFVLRSDDGRWTLAPGLAVQLQLQIDSREEEGDWETEERVLLRRIRLTLTGRAISRDLSYCLQLSTAPNSLELLDLYLDYRFHEHLRLRGGQIKIPFTRYRAGSFKTLTFVDWALVSGRFGAERQIGLAAHNGHGKRPPRWQYRIGVFSGLNARASHATGIASIYGEPVGNPSDLTAPSPPVGLHPELVAHLAFNSGGVDSSHDSDFARGPLRFSGGVSAAWDLDPDRYVEPALRLAAEALVKLRGFSAAGALYLAFSRSGEGVGDQRFAMLGGLLQASYLLLPKIEIAARWALVALDGGGREHAALRAAQLVAAAPDEQARAELIDRYADAGRLRWEQEAGVGVNVYLFGRSLRWRSDLSWLVRSMSAGDRDQVRLRTQLQLAY